MNLAEQLRAHIMRTHLPGEDPTTVEVGDDLIDSGILDSMAIMQLVAHLESVYGIQVLPEEIQTDNFGTAIALAAYVGSKCARSQRTEAS